MDRGADIHIKDDEVSINNIFNLKCCIVYIYYINVYAYYIYNVYVVT
jgi:hypothetical protein